MTSDFYFSSDINITFRIQTNSGTLLSLFEGNRSLPEQRRVLSCGLRLRPTASSLPLSPLRNRLSPSLLPHNATRSHNGRNFQILSKNYEAFFQLKQNKNKWNCQQQGWNFGVDERIQKERQTISLYNHPCIQKAGLCHNAKKNLILISLINVKSRLLILKKNPPSTHISSLQVY